LEGWELMRIRGIPLRVHPSWFAILLLFTWTSQGQVSRVVDYSLPIWMSWGVGLITSILLFVSVLLHELGHSFVALNEGVKVHSITLFFLGGVARIERECTTAMSALRVAVAGPLVSIILAIGLLNAVNWALPISPLLAHLFGQLGSLNLVLALFNLLPGLPLDGGVILKAIVWHFTGSQKKGVKVANSTGRFLSIFAIVLGVYICLRGGGFGGLWMVILGWFGLAASRSQSQMLVLQQVLSDLLVSNAARKRFRVMEQDQSLRTLSQLRTTQRENPPLSDWILVCSSGRWIGYINDQPLKDLPVQNWDDHRLIDHIRPLSELPSIGDKKPLWKAVLELEKSKEGRLLVFNAAGLPSGTLDRIDLGEAVLKKLGLNLPSSFIESARNQNTYPLGMSLPKVVESMVLLGLVKKTDLESQKR